MDDDARAQTAKGLGTRSSLDLAILMADIVSAYVTNNSVQPRDLAVLIASVQQTLASLGKPAEAAAASAEMLSQARVRKSITPDGIVSFVDGKLYKTLKRHLTRHGLTPHSYRERFGLPSDYPMVAPNYSAQRSALAIGLGLGQMRKKTAAERATTAGTPRGARSSSEV